MPIIADVNQNLMAVDPTVKGIYMTPYGPDGLVKVPQGSFIHGLAPFGIKQSTTTSAATPVWILRSLWDEPEVGRKIYILRITAQLWFDGTGAATEMEYQFKRITQAGVVTAATQQAILWKQSTTRAVQAAGFLNVDCQYLDTGLTITNPVTQIPVGFTLRQHRITASATAAITLAGDPIRMDFIDHPIEISGYDALALYIGSPAAVAGDSIWGCVDFAYG